MQNIVAQIVTRGETAATFNHVSEVAPFLEIDPHWTDASPTRAGGAELAPSVRKHHETFGRRCFNTHLPWELMPGGSAAGRGDGADDAAEEDAGGVAGPRYVYLARDGRDAAVSFYHHLSNQDPADGGYVGGWNAFFDEWVRGDIPFGTWVNHIDSWRRAAVEDPRVLLIRYAELKSDLRGCVGRVATHIGCGDVPGDVLDAIAEKTSFEAMKRDIGRFQPRSVAWVDPEYSFIRKGKVGDHVALFTTEQLARFDAAVRAKFGVAAEDAPLVSDEGKET